MNIGSLELEVLCCLLQWVQAVLLELVEEVDLEGQGRLQTFTEREEGWAVLLFEEEGLVEEFEVVRFWEGWVLLC